MNYIKPNATIISQIEFAHKLVLQNTVFAFLLKISLPVLIMSISFIFMSSADYK